MSRLVDMVDKLKAFSFEEVMRETIAEQEAWVTEMVSEDQLYEKGETGKGVRIDSYRPYHPETVRQKREKGQPTDRVTLRDTRAFHRSFTLRFSNDGFEIIATDKKTDDLKAKYGEEIMMLNEENFLDLLHSYIVPRVSEKLRRI